MERERKLPLYFIFATVFNAIRGKCIPPEDSHSWHWKAFAILFVRHLESLGLLWNPTLQPKRAFSLVETWVSWRHGCPNILGYSGLITKYCMRKFQFYVDDHVQLQSIPVQCSKSPGPGKSVIYNNKQYTNSTEFGSFWLHILFRFFRFSHFSICSQLLEKIQNWSVTSSVK